MRFLQTIILTFSKQHFFLNGKRSEKSFYNTLNGFEIKNGREKKVFICFKSENRKNCLTFQNEKLKKYNRFFVSPRKYEKIDFVF